MSNADPALPASDTNRTVENLIDNRYFVTLVQEKVESIANAYLAKWRNLVAFILAIILPIVGWESYSAISRLDKAADKVDATSIKIENKQSELVQRVNAAENDLARIQSNIALSTQYVESAQNQLESSGQMAQASQQLLSSAGGMIQSQTATWETRQNDLQQLQNTISAQNETLSKNLITEKQIAEQSRVLDEQKHKYEEEFEKVEQIHNLNKTLFSIGQVEDILLRSKHTREFVMRSLGSDEHTIENYTFHILVPGIKNEFVLQVKASKDSQAEEAHLYCYKLDKNEHGIHGIKGTPFAFQLEFIYHATLAYDFVAIKVIENRAGEINDSHDIAEVSCPPTKISW